MTPRVLAIVDDVDLAEMLGIVLRIEGLRPVFCYRGPEAPEALRREQPDLVLLDIMDTDPDGLQVCAALREQSIVPIVMLSARGDTSAIVAGLEAGADDYIVKPFKPRELTARLRALLRRAEPRAAQPHSIGDLIIDPAARSVSRNALPVALTPLEFDLLTALASRPGHAFTREQLLREVWGYADSGDTRLVNVHVQRLRSKVEQDPEHPTIVVTVRGVGYRAGPP